MIISRTPLRISFVGGGTDLRGYYRTPGRHGAVVSAAINRYIYITVNRKFDDLIRLSYSKAELVDSIDKIEHNIIREAMRIVGVDRGIELVYMADLPLTSVGSGLGSSSALAVGVLNALYAYRGMHVSAERLAREACAIEQDILGHPVGKQDQYAAAFGGLNYIRFNSDETVFVDPVIALPETKRRLNEGLMLFYTGINRYSTEILAAQSQGIAAKLDLHDELARLADRLRDRLCDNDFDALGEMLHEGWMVKSRLADGISTPKIEEWYARGRAAGAIGGKIAGAGGGGFLLFFCPPERQDAVKRALSDLVSAPVEIEPQGSKIIYVSD